MQAESSITVVCVQMEPKIGEKKANVAHSLESALIPLFSFHLGIAPLAEASEKGIAYSYPFKTQLELFGPDRGEKFAGLFDFCRSDQARTEQALRDVKSRPLPPSLKANTGCASGSW
jgi:hypothetical protein